MFTGHLTLLPPYTPGPPEIFTSRDFASIPINPWRHTLQSVSHQLWIWSQTAWTWRQADQQNFRGPPSRLRGQPIGQKPEQGRFAIRLKVVTRILTKSI